jgi:branched-subunit amino acid aminotransferase/4-amino-4-deoxychorismate lyase
VPVREINKRLINSGKPGPITRRLMEEFVKLVSDPKQGIQVHK